MRGVEMGNWQCGLVGEANQGIAAIGFCWFLVLEHGQKQLERYLNFIGVELVEDWEICGKNGDREGFGWVWIGIWRDLFFGWGCFFITAAAAADAFP